MGTRSNRQRKSVLFHRQRGRCCYCEKPINFEKSTLEHLKPKSEGGTSCWNNLAMSCKPCNNNRPRCISWISWKSVCLGEMNLTEAFSFS